MDDPKIRDLARRVGVVESEELNELCQLREKGDPRGRFASTVTITLKDGKKLNSGMIGEAPFPPPGWDENRVEEKFRWLAAFVLLDEARVNALVDMLWHFEEVPNVRELTQMLA